MSQLNSDTSKPATSFIEGITNKVQSIKTEIINPSRVKKVISDREGQDFDSEILNSGGKRRKDI